MFVPSLSLYPLLIITTAGAPRGGDRDRERGHGRGRGRGDSGRGRPYDRHSQTGKTYILTFSL